MDPNKNDNGNEDTLEVIAPSTIEFKYQLFNRGEKEEISLTKIAPLSPLIEAQL